VERGGRRTAALIRADNAVMKITFKLFASLTDYLPPHAKGENQVVIEVDPAATIAQIVEPYGLPHKLVHLVLVNGHYVAPADRATRTLQAGDVLAIWPPIAGG
jgi:sulfur carrier protein ThiS